MKVYVAHVPFIANNVAEVEWAIQWMMEAYQKQREGVSSATIPVRPELSNAVRIEQA